ncbi:hypothetical protein KS4_00410 [Poriferisphaera corsica]|uniref:Uncharacterized protein n=1 Tax=Poriferisphaera corsica TaxID=2528020 RepID=A0A517YP71_9BACT|nr:LamG domain-containing protein [Poriferisphaera corsica]QDU32013.1 hypothetical protein KS4_00410 [Poriferisphaera corsica]
MTNRAFCYLCTLISFWYITGLAYSSIPATYENEKYGVQAYWAFDDDIDEYNSSGNYYKDHSGHNRNLITAVMPTLSSPNFQSHPLINSHYPKVPNTGRVNDAYVKVSKDRRPLIYIFPANEPLWRSYTIEGSFRLRADIDQITEFNRFLFSFDRSDFLPNPNDIDIFVKDDGHLKFLSDHPYVSLTMTNHQIQHDKWYHFAVVSDGKTLSLILGYKDTNGEFVTDEIVHTYTNTAEPSIVVSEAQISVGGVGIDRGWGDSNALGNGDMDEVRLSNIAIAPAGLLMNQNMNNASSQVAVEFPMNSSNDDSIEEIAEPGPIRSITKWGDYLLGVRVGPNENIASFLGKNVHVTSPYFSGATEVQNLVIHVFMSRDQGSTWERIKNIDVQGGQPSGQTYANLIVPTDITISAQDGFVVVAYRAEKYDLKESNNWKNEIKDFDKMGLHVVNQIHDRVPLEGYYGVRDSNYGNKIIASSFTVTHRIETTLTSRIYEPIELVHVDSKDISTQAYNSSLETSYFVGAPHIYRASDSSCIVFYDNEVADNDPTNGHNQLIAYRRITFGSNHHIAVLSNEYQLTKTDNRILKRDGMATVARVKAKSGGRDKVFVVFEGIEDKTGANRNVVWGLIGELPQHNAGSSHAFQNDEPFEVYKSPTKPNGQKYNAYAPYIVRLYDGDEILNDYPNYAIAFCTDEDVYLINDRAPADSPSEDVMKRRSTIKVVFGKYAETPLYQRIFSSPKTVWPGYMVDVRDPNEFHSYMPGLVRLSENSLYIIVDYFNNHQAGFGFRRAAN